MNRNNMQYISRSTSDIRSIKFLVVSAAPHKDSILSGANGFDCTDLLWTAKKVIRQICVGAVVIAALSDRRMIYLFSKHV